MSLVHNTHTQCAHTCNHNSYCLTGWQAEKLYLQQTIEQSRTPPPSPSLLRKFTGHRTQKSIWKEPKIFFSIFSLLPNLGSRQIKQIGPSGAKLKKQPQPKELESPRPSPTNHPYIQSLRLWAVTNYLKSQAGAIVPHVVQRERQKRETQLECN